MTLQDMHQRVKLIHHACKTPWSGKWNFTCVRVKSATIELMTNCLTAFSFALIVKQSTMGTWTSGKLTWLLFTPSSLEGNFLGKSARYFATLPRECQKSNPQNKLLQDNSHNLAVLCAPFDVKSGTMVNFPFPKQVWLFVYLRRSRLIELKPVNCRNSFTERAAQERLVSRF